MATNTNLAITSHGPPSSFASHDVKLNNDEFHIVLSFFGPEELIIIERVCKSWKAFIDTTDLWKKHCRYRLNIPAHLDPKSFLPSDWNYKKGAFLASPKVFDARMYQYYLGADVGHVPPIPEEISLENADEPDPYDLTQTIGKNYTWFFCPKEFILSDLPFDLNKQDDPNDEEAPGLILRESGTSEEERVLTVPNTINNIGKIFKHSKNGTPSEYKRVWAEITNQIGNNRETPTWVCMREPVIGRGLLFNEQQEDAKKAGVVISSLLHRVFFNFLRHTCSGTYPDGQNPPTHARVSIFMRDFSGTIWSSCCLCGGSPGLRIHRNYGFGSCGTGAAVVLPVKPDTIDS